MDPNIKFFGILLMSFLFSAVLTVPFINLLYYLKFYKTPKKSVDLDLSTRNPAYYQFHGQKMSTPTGGGILIVASIFLFSLLFYSLTGFRWNWTSTILFLTVFLFGVLGLLDDLRKFFSFEKTGIWGLRVRYKLIIQVFFALFIGWLLQKEMGLQVLTIPVLSIFFHWPSIDLGFFYPFWAALVVIATSNAFNITDGLDGLATGLLMIVLGAFWFLATQSSFSGDILVFVTILLGSLVAFLYFNIFPARLFMGDTGALALGAMLGVVALMIQKELIFLILGGVFVLEAMSTLSQWAWLLFFKRKLFLIAPLHHHLQNIGWHETKITMRFWLLGILLAFVGIFIALI